MRIKEGIPLKTFSMQLFDWFKQAVKKSRVLEIPQNKLEILDKEVTIEGGMGKLRIATWKTKEKRVRIKMGKLNLATWNTREKTVVIKKVNTQTLDGDLHFIYEVSD